MTTASTSSTPRHRRGSNHHQQKGRRGAVATPTQTENRNVSTSSRARSWSCSNPSSWSLSCPSCGSCDDDAQRPSPSSWSSSNQMPSALLRRRSHKDGGGGTRGVGGSGGRFPWAATVLAVVVAFCSINDRSLFCADAVSSGEKHSCTVFDDGTVKVIIMFFFCEIRYTADFRPKYLYITYRITAAHCTKH